MSRLIEEREEISIIAEELHGEIKESTQKMIREISKIKGKWLFVYYDLNQHNIIIDVSGRKSEFGHLEGLEVSGIKTLYFFEVGLFRLELL